MEETNVKLNGYKIQKVLGKGGMAVVYLAIQESFDREVAIKIMAEHLSSDPSFGERFLREAKIVSRLIHPNIVTVYDVGVVGNQHFLSMEYIPGQDLKDKLHHITLAHIVKVIKEIGMALDFAGRKGYVHRDIKPENIMINEEDGRAVLMDFGIARAFDSVSGMTQTGTAIGTPYYMSPEQAKGKEVDWRSDLYSLGVVFYQLLVGKVPYDGDSAISVGIKHLSDPIPKLPDNLQDAFQPIIDKMMAKNPNDRFQSGGELVVALNAINYEQLTALSAAFDAQGNRETTSELAQHLSTPMSGSSEAILSPLSDSAATQVVSMPTDVHDVPKINLSNDDKRVSTDQSSSKSSMAILLGAAVVIALAGVGYVVMQPDEEPLPSTQLVDKDKVALDDNKSKLAKTASPIDVSPTPKDTKVSEQTSATPNQEDNTQLETETTDSAAEITTNAADTIKVANDNADNDKKIAALIEKSKLLAQQLDSNMNIADELHQTFQLISLLQQDHPEVVAGYEQLKDAYRNNIDKHIENKSFQDAEKVLNKKLSIFPELANSEQIRALRTKITTELSILDLLEKAQQKYASDNLTGSNKNDALHYYSQILSIDPKHVEAQKGMISIAQRYYQLAQGMIEEGRLEQALTFIKRGLSIDSNSRTIDKLTALQSTIIQQQRNQAEQQKQNEQLAQLQQLAQSQMTAGQFILPEDNNALATFQEILLFSPDNPSAVAGIKTIENNLANEISQLVSFNDFELAKQKLSQAKASLANSAIISLAEQELNAAIQAAEDATKPRINRLMLSGVELGDLLQDKPTKFSADRTVHIGFAYENFADGTAVLQAELYDGSRTVKITTVPVIITGTEGNKFFKITRPVNGFADGGYFLDLILNNEKLSTIQFSIEN